MVYVLGLKVCRELSIFKEIWDNNSSNESQNPSCTSSPLTNTTHFYAPGQSFTYAKHENWTETQSEKSAQFLTEMRFQPKFDNRKSNERTKVPYLSVPH